jgi:hypothetical protein
VDDPGAQESYDEEVDAYEESESQGNATKVEADRMTACSP